MKKPTPRSALHSGLRAGILTLVLLAAPLAQADIVASEGWSRVTPPRTTTGVGYLVLTNTGGESRSLLRIISPVSDRVMIHRSSVDHNGVSRMWPVGELTLKPGETFRFDITEHRKHCLLNGLDEIGLTLAHDSDIKTFEAKHKAAQPWLFHA